MILRSLSDTRQLAREVLARLPEGSLLLLDGPMGAGKTTLVALLASELGSDASVSSPTYTLIHEYPTPQGTLVHIDAWRLPDVQALLAAGLDDYLDNSRLVAVEWGAGLAPLYPGATVLSLRPGPADDERTAELVQAA